MIPEHAGSVGAGRSPMMSCPMRATCCASGGNARGCGPMPSRTAEFPQSTLRRGRREASPHWKACAGSAPRSACGPCIPLIVHRASTCNSASINATAVLIYVDRPQASRLGHAALARALRPASRIESARRWLRAAFGVHGTVRQVENWLHGHRARSDRGEHATGASTHSFNSPRWGRPAGLHDPLTGLAAGDGAAPVGHWMRCSRPSHCRSRSTNF